MTSRPVLQTITIYNIPPTKGNQAMNFGQLIEYNIDPEICSILIF